MIGNCCAWNCVVRNTRSETVLVHNKYTSNMAACYVIYVTASHAYLVTDLEKFSSFTQWDST